MKKGILLINLGTPDSWKTADVRKYLLEFLLDERVIDIPSFQRNLLVRGIIGPFRAPKSSAIYQKIWTEEGSPLLIHTQNVAQLLQAKLGDNYQVEFAMRYGNPSIKSRLEKFKGKALEKLTVIPLYPQYSSATTGSTHQKVMEELSGWQTIPPVEFAGSFHDHPRMIGTFAEIGKSYQPESFDHILFSFHGLPERQLSKADQHGVCNQSPDCCFSLHEKNRFCYGAQCYDSAALIAKSLDIPKEKYTVCFQSRLGKTPWKQPYTSDVIQQLASEGVKKVLVFCPAFVCDCLETLYEIGMEYRDKFLELGGEELQLVEGLNVHPGWIDTLAELVG